MEQLPPGRLQLSLISGFELRCGEAVVPVAQSAQRLMAFVALRDRAVTRIQASGVLWSDVSEQRASSSLRSALWRTPSVEGRPVIEATNTHLWLNPDIDVDIRTVISEATSIVDPRNRATPAESDQPGTGGQVRQFGDDLLPGWYEDWVLVERERFRQLRLHALEAMCERLADSGHFALALEAGLAAVACEPLRESAHRQVIRSHLLEGNVAEALRQYRTYATLIDQEIGAKPSESMDRMLRAIVGDLHAALPVTPL